MDKSDEILQLLRELSKEHSELTAIFKLRNETADQQFEQWQTEQRKLKETWKQENDARHAEWRTEVEADRQENQRLRQEHERANAEWLKASEMRVARGCSSMLLIFVFGVFFGLAAAWLVWLVSK